MKKFSQFSLIIGLILIIGLATWLGLNALIPKESTKETPVTQTASQSYKKSIQFVAIGDSLTEGIGDQTDQGGYVSILEKALEEQYKTVSFTATNAGVAGQRSDQILNRINKDDTLQAKIKSADFITMSFGGNDLMKVIQQNIFSLSVKKVKTQQASYQEHVTALLTKIRELNGQAPVYIIGIYNPFYLNFSNIEEMQTIVDNWNDATQETIKEQRNMYFIPINDLIYKGTEGQTLQTDESVEKQTTNSTASSSVLQDVVENNVLSESDKFHPNKLGYQLIGKALKTEIVDTHSEWLLKE